MTKGIARNKVKCNKLRSIVNELHTNLLNDDIPFLSDINPVTVDLTADNNKNCDDTVMSDDLIVKDNKGIIDDGVMFEDYIDDEAEYVELIAFDDDLLDDD